jgi:hypothetical protein
MPASKRLTVPVEGDGNANPSNPLVGGKTRAYDPLRANYGTGDVRGKSRSVQTVTLQAPTAGDAFTLRVRSFPRAPAGGTVARGAFKNTDTAPLVVGTNCAATDLQTELRTATGDSTLTVSGTTDVGPFTVTFVGLSKHRMPELVAVTCTGVSISIARGALAYDDPVVTLSGAAEPGYVSNNGVHFDQESSLGFGETFPLGTSAQTDGSGQTRGAELLPPTLVSAVGGVGQVVIDNTEAASGGTGAYVLYAIYATETGDFASSDVFDADADLTTSSLAAGNYYLLAHTVTVPAGSGTVYSRISRPAAPQYFTVT